MIVCYIHQHAPTTSPAKDPSSDIGTKVRLDFVPRGFIMTVEKVLFLSEFLRAKHKFGCVLNCRVLEDR